MEKFKSFATGQSLNQDCEFPINSTNKYQVSIHESQDHKDNYLFLMKGIVLTDHRKDAFETAYIKLGGIGKRVLRFCDFILPKAKHPTRLLSQMRKIPLEDLRFVGLMSIIDPP